MEKNSNSQEQSYCQVGEHKTIEIDEIQKKPFWEDVNF